MKRFLLPSLALLLIGCGPSEQDKQETAIITCNIMGESRNMDAALRIREINSARESIGEDAYLGTDSEIVEAFQYDLCRELVLNDPEYSAKLMERAEARRIAIEEQEEAQRIAREEKEEAERIAYQKNQQEYTDSILSVFEEYPPSFSFNGFYTSRGYVELEYDCINSLGFDHTLKFEFEGNLGKLEATALSNCVAYPLSVSKYSVSPELQDLYEVNSNNFVQKIEKITVEWNGEIYLFDYEDNFSTNVEERGECKG